MPANNRVNPAAGVTEAASATACSPAAGYAERYVDKRLMKRSLLAVFNWLLLVPIGAPAAPSVLEEFAIVAKHDFSSLTLFTDGTFLYKSRGSSCWTWGDASGQWYRRGERLELVYTVKYSASRTEITVQRKKGDPARVFVFVVDPDGLPLRDVGVTFNHGAEYLPTAADGSVIFEFAELPALYRSQKPESKQLEILNLQAPGTTTSMSISEKRANWFKVVYEIAPPEREETRTDVFSIRGDELVLIGAEKVTLRKVVPE